MGQFVSFLLLQVCQVSVQPPVNGELILRFQQLQSRLTTLKIENEEVKRKKVTVWVFVVQLGSVTSSLTQCCRLPEIWWLCFVFICWM